MSYQCLKAAACGVLIALVMAACVTDGGGYGPTSVSVGYHHGFYGPRPWGYYGRPPIIIDPGPDIDEPIAVPLPMPEHDFDMGFPDAGFLDF